VSLNLNDKKAVVAEVSQKVATAQTIVVAEYRGIQVGHLTQLRANLGNDMTGPLIYAISDDAVAAAKVTHEFAKSNDKLVIRAGNYAGKALDKAGVAALASIPAREVLLAQLAGMMKAPVAGFARGLAALAAKKESGSPVAAEAAAE